MKNKKKIVSVVLSATLLTSFFGTSGALASGKTMPDRPVPVKTVVHKKMQYPIVAQTQTIPVRNVPIKTIANVNGKFQTQGAVSWTYRIVKNALRHGGWLLSQVLRPLSPRVAAWVRKNSAKIAKIMDKGEKWSENQFYRAFRAMGAPPDIARALAKFIISLL
ncbi:hypothetical protein HOO54_15530 [Bacillus sp. WMMC1349]|uniref:hypothetical protein n=1 Tax=Bacillus sp. WMMC1349 TaxID=2736254 RepID=UPI001553BF07|nr:hypothetical protein [Bacillus sp. WMMC1349]NPC93607.1 hypothetical protein [Bacillus sp. WMMC1349]